MTEDDRDLHMYDHGSLTLTTGRLLLADPADLSEAVLRRLLRKGRSGLPKARVVTSPWAPGYVVLHALSEGDELQVVDLHDLSRRRKTGLDWTSPEPFRLRTEEEIEAGVWPSAEAARVSAVGSPAVAAPARMRPR